MITTEDIRCIRAEASADLTTARMNPVKVAHVVHAAVESDPSIVGSTMLLDIFESEG
jgi:hypothetical protein